MKIKKFACILVLILIAVLSFTKVSVWTSDPANREHNIEQIDKNISVVLKLSAGSAATSVAVTMLPGDVATPVANQLAEMSKYFLAILSALYLEKYLITLTGYVAFKWLIPIACILAAVWIGTEKNFLIRFAGKIALFALAIYMVIPVSVKFSEIIYQTYEVSMESTIEDMDNYEVSSDDSSSILDKVSGAVTNAVDSAVNKATGLVSNLIESIAVLLTISCIIPILVFISFAWMIKMIFGNLPVSADFAYAQKIKEWISEKRTED